MLRSPSPPTMSAEDGLGAAVADRVGGGDEGHATGRSPRRRARPRRRCRRGGARRCSSTARARARRRVLGELVLEAPRCDSPIVSQPERSSLLDRSSPRRRPGRRRPGSGLGPLRPRLLRHSATRARVGLPATLSRGRGPCACCDPPAGEPARSRRARRGRRRGARAGSAALGVGLLAAAEHDRDLDLVLLVQEALDVALLGLVVVVGDLRAQLDLADVDLLLVLAGLLGLLLLLVLVLRVVEQPADGRARVGGDLDQVEIAPRARSGGPRRCRRRRPARRRRRSGAPWERGCAR